jgi:hypothetical protein
VTVVDDTLAVRLFAHDELAQGNLLGDEGGDVGLEATGANAHNDKADEEGGKGVVGLGDDRGDGRDDEDDVAGDGNGEGHADGLVPAEILVGQVGAKEGDEVDPELVEGSNAGGSVLAHVQGAGLAISAASAGS